MSILFSSTFGGLSMLWDREFGFLKEIMVAPVSRVSIVLGRIAGGATTTLIQAILILGISFIMGFKVASVSSVFLALVFMTLISITFLGLGLIFASKMRDMQGFSIVMNFVIFPLFFLSGALYPLDNFPVWLRTVSKFNPLTYGVDGQNNGDSALFIQFLDVIPDMTSRLGIQTERLLIQKQNLRLMNQSSPNLQSSLHPARIILNQDIFLLCQFNKL